jgi:hypothetical protein
MFPNPLISLKIPDVLENQSPSPQKCPKMGLLKSLYLSFSQSPLTQHLTYWDLFSSQKKKKKSEHALLRIREKSASQMSGNSWYCFSLGASPLPSSRVRENCRLHADSPWSSREDTWRSHWDIQKTIKFSIEYILLWTAFITNDFGCKSRLQLSWLSYRHNIEIS